MARLTIIGPEGRQEVELLGHNTLGRHPNNTVQVLDRIVSKEHCHLDMIDGGRYVLRDLGSLNGTYVNGERVSERILHPGDEITLGSTRIIFDADAAGRLSASQRPQPVPAPEPPPPMPPPEPSTLPLGSAAAAPVPDAKLSRVTIAPGMVESHIRTKLAPLIEQSFLPERLIQDVDALRRDYEKLRVSYELARAIGVELDIDKALVKILDAAFQLLQADRGVVLLYDENQRARAALRTHPRR